jgi:hypothetical protein
LIFYAFFHGRILEGEMSKAARVAGSSSLASTSSQKSEGHPLVAIAIFCGIGLLATLVAILMGMELTLY